MTRWATLRALAEKATKGEISPEDDFRRALPFLFPVSFKSSSELIDHLAHELAIKGFGRISTDYIAASHHAAILALIAENERLREGLAELAQHCDAMESQNADYHTDEGPRLSAPLSAAFALLRDGGGDA